MGAWCGIDTLCQPSSSSSSSSSSSPSSSSSSSAAASAAAAVEAPIHQNPPLFRISQGDSPPQRKRGAHILDVGTGTGLLALMLAQRTEHLSTSVVIHGIDIDRDSAEEARRNFVDSPWNDRLHAHHCSLQDIAAESKSDPNIPSRSTSHPFSFSSAPTISPASLSHLSFDIVVCNPPYFTLSTPSAHVRRARARHDSTLTLRQLLRGSLQITHSNSRLNLVLPASRSVVSLCSRSLLSLVLDME